MALKWYGPQVVRKVRQSSEDAINDVMQKAVRHARANHPGWSTVSGRAENSIKVQEPAKPVPTGVRGIWGSRGVPYMLRLEFSHGRALINAADRTYGELPKHIRTRFRFRRSGRR